MAEARRGKAALETFIPRDGIHNKQCTMFLNVEPQLVHFPEDFEADTAKLSAWNSGKAIK